MSQLGGIIKVPWTRQPTRAAMVDRSNPLTNNVLECIAAHCRYTSAATGLPLVSYSGGFQGITIRPQGITFPVPSNTPQGVRGTRLVSNLIAQSTLVWYGYLNSTFAGFRKLATAGVGLTNGYCLYWSNTNIGASVGTAANAVDVGTFAASTGVPYFVVFRVSGASQQFFVNGTLIADASQAYVAPTGGTNYFSIGSDPSWQYGAAASVLYSALWTRLLSDAEVAELSSNPWQIYAP